MGEVELEDDEFESLGIVAPPDADPRERSFRLYCARDSHATVLSARSMIEELKADQLWEFYTTIVQPLARVLVNINMRGLPVSEEALTKAASELESEITELQKQIEYCVGREINVNSPELGAFLYDELGIRCPSRSAKTGKGSTNKASLKKVQEYEPALAPLIERILRKKKLGKLKNTFVHKEGIEENWRLYPNYRIGPATGRLACRKPNFQNYPEGPARSIFRALPGYKFVYADYSQVELRILAILAVDEILLETFDLFDRGLSKEDVHTRNARDLFGLGPDDVVTSRQRFFAKMFVYRLIYGGSVTGEGLKEVGAELFADVPLEVIEAASRRFLGAHPKIVAFRKSIEIELRTKRKLYNAFGRPRIFFGDPRESIRAALNFPMQSGAADLMNTRLILVDKYIPNSLVLQVHDSLMLEVKEEEAEHKAKLLKEILQEPIKEFGGYRFPAKVQIGDSWGDF